jgi:hypothetical protein
MHTVDNNQIGNFGEPDVKLFERLRQHPNDFAACCHGCTCGYSHEPNAASAIHQANAICCPQTAQLLSGFLVKGVIALTRAAKQTNG